ncbi:nitrogen fixation protein NifX [Phaeovulum vinaykumarii]|uniref:Nitrogen fixation protein NifX n=2 Tax=Phaeovulum vinaykumarii TaxID=407234 RepID=A0A1N7LKK2_9RHOB|nr:nitrogen fixation protein NifX [Phaeovulum vinaykumarii]SOC04995.1 nitrogen fixation protein NifX [Phaeovulum vinaykumarii]
MPPRRLRVIEAESPMSETDDPALRVAIATNDLENLNAHFGSARNFAIYEVSASAARLLEVVAFDSPTAQSARHDDEVDRIGPKIEALEGAALMFVLAIGGPSAARVVRAGVHPIKRKEPEPISAVIEQVQTMLKGNPPPFLRKALGMKRSDFLDDLISEESEA